MSDGLMILLQCFQVSVDEIYYIAGVSLQITPTNFDSIVITWHYVNLNVMYPAQDKILK